MTQADNTSQAILARQPIFDFAHVVVAYELLYREGAEGRFPREIDGAVATARVLESAAFDVGLDVLVGALPVFVNMPESLLFEAPFLPLAPERVVIEILETVPVSDSVRAAIQALKNGKYRIALDDFSGTARDWSLIDLADIVKVDISLVDSAELPDLVRRLKLTGKHLIAEKVETLADLETCRSLGFDGFQGYVLQRPELFRGRRISSDRVATLQLVTQLHDPEYDIGRIEQCLARDVSLSLKVLRCVNSGFYGRQRRVDSLRQAIIALGAAQLLRLCSTVALSGFDERPAFVQHTALMRARMCQLLAEDTGETDTAPYFLVGLLSNLDVLLGLPMDEAVASLPLQPSLHLALLGDDSDLSKALWCVRAYERQQLADIRFRDLSPERISRANLSAVQWAEASLQGLAS